MTSEEHGLILAVFARQLQLIKGLAALLESKGILEKGDITAFFSWAQTDEKVADDMIRIAREDYYRFAESLGLMTGIGPPESRG